MYMNTERNGGSESRKASPDGAAELMVSSQGRARAAPAPRKTVLREILLDISLSPCRLSCLISFDHHWARTFWARRRRFHDYGAALAIPEGRAEHHFTNECSCAVLIFLQRLGQMLNSATVSILQIASESVSEHFAGEVPKKLLLPLEHHIAEFRGTIEFFAGRKRAAHINPRAVEFFVAPA